MATIFLFSIIGIIHENGVVNMNNEVFLTGYAKLPDGITAKELYDVIALALVVNRRTGEIMEAEITLSTNVARNFISRVLVGENLEDISNIETKIMNSYYGSANKAIVTATKICHSKFKKIKDG